MELIFEVRDAEEGGYYTTRSWPQASSPKPKRGTNFAPVFSRPPRFIWKDNYEHPRLVQLHYVKDELIPVEAA